MNGIRENLFVVVLIGVTVVLAGVLLLWGFSIDEKIEDEEMAERVTLSEQIQRLSRPTSHSSNRSTFNNQNTIEAAKRRVDDLNRALAGVCQENVKWNSRNFDVVSLELLKPKGGTCPALPYSSDLWYANRLDYRFVTKCHMRLDALLAILKPTTPPAEAEITSKATEVQRRLDRDELIRLKGLEGKAGERSTGGVRPGFEGEMDMLAPGLRRGPSRTGAGDIKLSPEAIQEAQESLKLSKAQQGRIYATMDSLNVMFPKDFTGRLSPKQVWNAQLSLWVQTDILQAISQTISEEMANQKLTGLEQNVTRSPIKRLRRIVVGSQVDASTAPRNDFPMMEDMHYGASKKPAQKDADRIAAKPLTLTRNADNPLFDVVNYSFTVLMPTRYIPALQENLLKRNYHVILNQQIHKSLEKKPTVARPGVESGDLYYYGTESVRWVTFTGQLLLLTDWMRGTYDEEKKKWDYEPLMPLEVLKDLPKEAWRPVDKYRVEDIDLKKRGRPLKLTAPEIKIRGGETAPAPDKAKKTTP
ncbi:MAG: hypothetical protein K8S55_08655 [Phycisphaerae bacterium]|nr:hypothetical protein [Phycisphaerae bacterium]